MSGTIDGRYVINEPLVLTPRSVAPDAEPGGVYIDADGILWTTDGDTWTESASSAIAAAVPDNVNSLTLTQARTATAAPGGTTGVITAGTDFVTVTSDDANKVITLPTPTPGTVIALSNGATGYELRSSAPATVAINGGTAADAESAIPANTLVVCVCRTATAWLCSNTDTAGSSSATEVAA